MQQNAGHKALPRGGKTQEQAELVGQIDDGYNGADQKRDGQQHAHHNLRRVFRFPQGKGRQAQAFPQYAQDQGDRQDPLQIFPGIAQHSAGCSIHTIPSFTPG